MASAECVLPEKFRYSERTSRNLDPPQIFSRYLSAEERRLSQRDETGERGPLPFASSPRLCASARVPSFRSPEYGWPQRSGAGERSGIPRLSKKSAQICENLRIPSGSRDGKVVHDMEDALPKSAGSWQVLRLRDVRAKKNLRRNLKFSLDWRRAQTRFSFPL